MAVARWLDFIVLVTVTVENKAVVVLVDSGDVVLSINMESTVSAGEALSVREMGTETTGTVSVS